MCGHTDLVDNFGHLRFQILHFLLRFDDGAAALFVANPLNAFGEQRIVERLDHTVCCACIAAFLKQVLVGKTGQHNEAGFFIDELLMQILQKLNAVHLADVQVTEDYLRLRAQGEQIGIVPVVRFGNDFNILLFQRLCAL